MQREKARETQKLFHRFREVGSTADPMSDPVQVESNQFLSMTVGQWIIGAQLLHETAIPGALVMSSHDAIERPVGTASQGKTDG